jgi:hypothetical protein
MRALPCQGGRHSATHQLEPASSHDFVPDERPGTGAKRKRRSDIERQKA